MSVVTRRWLAHAGRRWAALNPTQVRSAAFTAAVAGTAAAGVALSDATPTGLAFVDHVWVGGLVATVAYLSATARRWAWFLPAGVGAALSGADWATAAAALALAVTFWSVLTDTRSRARGALVGGLGTVALLGAGDVGFHGLTALATAAAVAPACATGYEYAGRRTQAKVRRVATVVGVGCLLMGAGAVLGLVSVYRDLNDGANLIDDGLAAAREADDDLAGERLSQAARHLRGADSTLSSWFVNPARALPIVGPNIDAVESLADDAADVAEVTSAAAEDADVDTLRFIGGQISPRAVAAMEEPLIDSLAAVEALHDTLVSSGRSPWLVSPLADRMDLLTGRLDDAIPDGEAAVEAVRHAPWLLGADAPRRYLVLFVTPVEARGRTGFPGNFAELVVDNGRLSMPRFGRISELEQEGLPAELRTLAHPEDYVARYDRFDPAGTLRNLTMSPDFPSVAAAARELYPQAAGAYIDGVLAIDPEGLAGLLRYTDPVEVEGLPNPLDADNAAQFLLLDQYVRFTDVSERIDVLEEVARTTFERLTSADLPSPRALSESLDPLVDEGHIQFTVFNRETAAWLDTVGLPGGLGEVDGDALAVTTSNAGGSKIDVFLRRQVRYDVTWDPATQQVSGTVTLALTNDAPESGLPDYVIGNTVGLPRGTNRSFLSVYTPHGLAAARVDGQPAAFGSERELGRNVYSTFVDIPPNATVLVELDVRGTVEGTRYALDLAHQPLVNPEQAEVNVEVAGDLPLDASATGGDMAQDGRTVTWSGDLDRRRTVRVTASN